MHCTALHCSALLCSQSVLSIISSTTLTINILHQLRLALTLQLAIALQIVTEDKNILIALLTLQLIIIKVSYTLFTIVQAETVSLLRCIIIYLYTPRTRTLEVALMRFSRSYNS